MRLRLFSTLLILLSLQSHAIAQTGRQTAPSLSKIVLLDVDDVLAWRSSYEELFEKPVGLAIERFGSPDSKTANALYFYPSPKTDYRLLSITFSDKSILSVKVQAKQNDILPVTELLLKARNFCFKTGIDQNTRKRYFLAQTTDGKSTVQFSTDSPSISFDSVIFVKTSKECDPDSFAPKI